MAITELTLFHLKNNESITSPSNEGVQTKLRAAIDARVSRSKYPSYLFTQVEDLSYIYLLGGWDSVKAHSEEWLASETREKLVATLQDAVEVVWTQHLKLGLEGLQTPTENSDNGIGKIPIDAPVLSVGRYFIPKANTAAFQGTFTATKSGLEAFVAPRTMDGGWRLDPEAVADQASVEKEEFVLFGGFGAVEEHSNFAKTEAFKEFSKIRDFMDGFEIKHVTPWANA